VGQCLLVPGPPLSVKGNLTCAMGTCNKEQNNTPGVWAWINLQGQRPGQLMNSPGNSWEKLKASFLGQRDVEGMTHPQFCVQLGTTRDGDGHPGLLSQRPVLHRYEMGWLP
jgi:hypothetical protein